MIQVLLQQKTSWIVICTSQMGKLKFSKANDPLKIVLIFFYITPHLHVNIHSTVFNTKGNYRKRQCFIDIGDCQSQKPPINEHW